MHAHYIGTVPVLCCLKSHKTIDSYCCGYTADEYGNNCCIQYTQSVLEEDCQVYQFNLYLSNPLLMPLN